MPWPTAKMGSIAHQCGTAQISVSQLLETRSPSSAPGLHHLLAKNGRPWSGEPARPLFHRRSYLASSPRSGYVDLIAEQIKFFALRCREPNSHRLLNTVAIIRPKESSSMYGNSKQLTVRHHMACTRFKLKVFASSDMCPLKAKFRSRLTRLDFSRSNASARSSYERWRGAGS